MSKTTFALQVGMSRERLFNYESGRTPVPWHVGNYVCNVYNVNPLWLATGEGLPFVRFGWGDDQALWRKPNSFLFSEGVNQMTESVKAYLREGQTSELPRAVYRHSANDLTEAVKEMAEKWLTRVPLESRLEFVERLRSAGDALVSATLPVVHPLRHEARSSTGPIRKDIHPRKR